MRKRIISLSFVFVTVMCLLCSCGIHLEQQNGYYQISTAEDLRVVAKHPDKKYVLVQDIDMSGEDWTPVTDFSGEFDGNRKTISNLTITSTGNGGKDMGLFANMTQQAKVKDLNLENVCVVADQTTAQNIGTISGSCSGVIDNCTATGTVEDTRTDVQGQSIYVGCLAGKATENASIIGGNIVSVTDDNGIYTTSCLCADVKLFVADSETVSCGLVGKADGAEVSGKWRDSFYSSARLSDTMRQRQKKVVDYMYAMGSVAWTTPVTLTHNAGKGSIHTQIFEPGQTYYGIPYNHTGRSYQSFSACLDENNQVMQWAVDLGDSQWLDGDNTYGFTLYMGNDCSSAVGWAWHQVSACVVGFDSNGQRQNGVYVYLTNQMIPNSQNQDAYGVYPVGSWNGQKFMMKGAVYNPGTMENTPDIIETNGVEKIFEAYAHARKADGLVYGDPGGHARLIAADPVVIRNGDGSIDPEMSYILAHEQGDGLHNNRFLNTNSSWRLNYRYTFQVLACGSDKQGMGKLLEGGSGPGYLPITIYALRSEEVPQAYAMEGSQERSITAPMVGWVYSNYKILSTTVTVVDSAGNTVYDREVYTGLEGDFESVRGSNVQVNLAHYHTLKDLPAGSYTFTVQARLSDDSVHTVVENRTFIQE